MLRLNPNNIEDFLDKYKLKLMTSITKYIPLIVSEESDDISAFVTRILDNARENSCFNRTFGHKSNSNHIDTSDIDAYARHVLLCASNVNLKKIILEPHVAITPKGEFKPFTSEIPQITISWVMGQDEFQCLIHFVNGDIEKIKSWKI